MKDLITSENTRTALKAAGAPYIQIALGYTSDTGLRNRHEIKRQRSCQHFSKSSVQGTGNTMCQKQVPACPFTKAAPTTMNIIMINC